MATKFTKGQTVKVNTVVPQGEILALRMTENGEFFYQFAWTDAKGVEQLRWFAEDELVAVE